VGFQLLSKHTLAFQQIPTGPGPGIYLKPSMLLSIAASSKYVKDSATFINFLINDPAGIRAIALDRGVPGKLSSQTVLQPVLATSDKNVLTYYNMVTSSGISTPKTVLDPPGVSKIITILGTVAQQVGFGKLSVTAGAQSFVQQAQQALA
jgi:multiple sugar transport system substrate-binding protein